MFKQRLGVALILATCAGVTLLESQLETRLPGSMYPAVLYHKPPSFMLAFAWASTEGILRVAIWSFVCIFPLKLEESRSKATEAANLERAYALAQLRERLEPARVSDALVEIGHAIERDPHRAREQLAEFGNHLDKLADPDLGAPAETLRKNSGLDAAVLTPTLRAPLARQQFVMAILAIASLFALNSLPHAVEYGWTALRLDLVALVRIAAEIALFWIVAERASQHDIPVMRTIGWTLCGSLALGLLATLITIRMEASFPGVFFPQAIYTHPTPSMRLLVRAVTTAFVDVAFWTLVYLYPLASAEAAERAALAMDLRRKAELARLRATLAPHFVRNALNVIAGLVTEDPQEARRLLQGLGELLIEFERNEENHSLAREMKWLRAYTTLLEARHPDRLSFSFESDPRVEKMMIPRLLLQPLVENAVIHGALSREEGGHVRVIIALGANPDQLVCTVEDDGPGMRREHREGGVGMRLVRERLATHLQGGRLTYHSTNKGTRAVLELPEKSPS